MNFIAIFTDSSGIDWYFVRETLDGPAFTRYMSHAQGMDKNRAEFYVKHPIFKMLGMTGRVHEVAAEYVHKYVLKRIDEKAAE